jgi:hypothetical protein
MQTAIRWMIGASIGFFCCFLTAQQTTSTRGLPLTSIIEALEKTQARTRPRVSYQVIREYHLSGTNDSKSDSDVIAEVDFKPPTSKNYRIQMSSGSDRGQHVVRRVLDNEVDSASSDNQARTTLSRDNYDFAYIGEVILDGQPCYLLGVKPKRKEKNLISGEVWVDQHTFLARQIEGEMAKTPSWWLKKVSVKLRFADLDGTWLPSNVEAVADVRVFGPHTLTSHILDYRVADEVASTMPQKRFLDHKQ